MSNVERSEPLANEVSPDKDEENVPWYDTALKFLRDFNGEEPYQIAPEDCCEHRVYDGEHRNGFFSAYNAILEEKQKHCEHDMVFKYESSEYRRNWDTFQMVEVYFKQFECSKCGLEKKIRIN